MEKILFIIRNFSLIRELIQMGGRIAREIIALLFGPGTHATIPLPVCDEHTWKYNPADITRLN